MNIEPEELIKSPFFAGVLGSIVALKFAPGVNWIERASNVTAGSMCAGFGAPALTEWLRLESSGMQSFAAFGVGLFGLSLCAAILQGIRDTKLGEIWSGWMSRRQ